MDTALRTFYHVPLLGWMTRDALQGAPDAKYYFVANITVLFGALVYRIGYPFVIVTALVAAFLMLSTIVLFTAFDFIDQRKRGPHSGPARRRN